MSINFKKLLISAVVFPSCLVSGLNLRRDFHGNEVNHFDPQNPKYYESIATLSLPTTVVGIAVLIIAWLLVIFRSIQRMKNGENYIRSHQRIEIKQSTGIVIIIGSLLLAGVSATAIYFNTILHNSLYNLLETLDTGIIEVFHRETAVWNAAVHMNLTMLVQSKDIIEIMDISRNTAMIFDSVRWQASWWEDVRYGCMVSFSVIIISASIFCLVTLIRGKRNALNSSSFAGFTWGGWRGAWIILFLLFIAFFQCVEFTSSGAHTSVSVLSADVCEATGPGLTDVIVNPMAKSSGTDPALLSSVFEYFLYCRGDNPLNPFVDGVDNLIVEIQQKLNETRHKGGPQKKIDLYEESIKDLTEILAVVQHLASCEYISNTFGGARGNICGDIKTGSIGASLTMGGTAILMLACLIYLCYIYARPDYFRGKYELLNIQTQPTTSTTTTTTSCVDADYSDKQWA